jgi:hypothetical protein
VLVTASKRPTHVGIALFDEAWKTRVEGTTVYTGTKITIVATLHEKTDGYSCKDPAYYPESTDKQPVDVYHRVEGGLWEKLFTVTTGVTSDHGTPGGCGADKIYTLTAPGKHEFYAEYAGNAYLEGCVSTVSAITIPGAPTPTPVPTWLIGLGIVAGACVLTLAVTKWLKWW